MTPEKLRRRPNPHAKALRSRLFRQKRQRPQKGKGSYRRHQWKKGDADFFCDFGLV